MALLTEIVWASHQSCFDKGRTLLALQEGPKEPFIQSIRTTYKHFERQHTHLGEVRLLILSVVALVLLQLPPLLVRSYSASAFGLRKLPSLLSSPHLQENPEQPASHSMCDCFHRSYAYSSVLTRTASTPATQLQHLGVRPR